MHLPRDLSLASLIEKSQISLTRDQSIALDIFTDFLSDDIPFTAMVLRGAAGTGKTFLLDLINRHLKRVGWQAILLAPTGRAAKVITRRARRYASTLHRHIYHPFDAPHGIVFELKDNRDEENVVYIVDEASMLGAGSEEKSGGSSLLGDFLAYAYQDGAVRKVLFVGDPAQLPPVGHTTSPALDPPWLREHHSLNVYETEMTEIMRQAAHSEILECAASVRENLHCTSKPSIPVTRGRDVVQFDNAEEALETFTSLYDSDNADKVVVITYSNFYATRINLTLRNRLFETEQPLVRGDRLMVVRNNYAQPEKNFPFIANGEPGTVVWVDSHIEERYGLKWMDAEVEFTGLDEQPVVVRSKVVVDLLTNKNAQLTWAEMNNLLAARRADLENESASKQKESLRKDPYLTALQAKYGYAITGHKAQGGQWQYVIAAFEPLYQGVNVQDYMRWTYTALTRAEERLYLLGWPFGNE